MHERNKLTNKINAGYPNSYSLENTPWCISSAVAARERSTQRSRVSDTGSRCDTDWLIVACFLVVPSALVPGGFALVSLGAAVICCDVLCQVLPRVVFCRCEDRCLRSASRRRPRFAPPRSKWRTRLAVPQLGARWPMHPPRALRVLVRSAARGDGADIGGTADEGSAPVEDVSAIERLAAAWRALSSAWATAAQAVASADLHSSDIDPHSSRKQLAAAPGTEHQSRSQQRRAKQARSLPGPAVNERPGSRRQPTSLYRAFNLYR